ncbi:uncharacterized protein LOC144388245 [Gasterosteus aculeatus]
MAGRRLAFNSSPRSATFGQSTDRREETAECSQWIVSSTPTTNCRYQRAVRSTGAFGTLQVSVHGGEVGGSGGTDSKKRRRAHNPTIAEAVRRLHNSEMIYRRYEPEQGLISPHNEAVTSYLLREKSRFRRRHCVRL